MVSRTQVSRSQFTKVWRSQGPKLLKYQRLSDSMSEGLKGLDVPKWAQGVKSSRPRCLRVLGIKVLIKVTRCQGVEVKRSRSQIRGCVRSNLKTLITKLLSNMDLRDTSASKT